MDTYSIRYVDRYAEQLWNTLFAKAPEVLLFEWSGMLRTIPPGDRAAWENLHTCFDYDDMLKSFRTNPLTGLADPTAARVAGYSLEQVDAFLGKLGKPIGIASYKPYQSTGEDFLHNYFGMIGIPVDLHPDFPTNADLVLLTESAKFDPDIVAKIKTQLSAGKSVVITSGLLRALQGRGIEDIAEIRITERKFLTREYLSSFGAGSSTTIGKDDCDVLFPQIDFLTNDAWALVRALANGRGYPILLMDKYSKGVLYVLAIPDNFSDLYRMPPEVTTAIKNYIMRDFPVRVEGAAQVALYAYDNNTFIVESYLPTKTDIKISVDPGFTLLRNLVTDETVHGQIPLQNPERGHQREPDRRIFNVQLLPHSYAVFAIEK